MRWVFKYFVPDRRGTVCVCDVPRLCGFAICREERVTASSALTAFRRVSLRWTDVGRMKLIR